jgi:hypothetical protein
LGRRWGLKTDIRFIPWDGDMDSGSVGDELEIVFSRDEDAAFVL